MDLRRLRPGEWIVGAAGVALFVSLFLDWYDVEDTDAGLNGWRAFEVVDVVLAIVAIAAIALAIVTATQPTPAIPVAMASLITVSSLVGLVLVVYRAIDEPDAAGGALSVSVGVWLALGACATLVAGSFLAIRDESPGAPAPPVEAEEIPAPRP